MPPGMGMGMGMGMNLNDAMDLNKDVEFISEQQSIEVYPLNYSLSIYISKETVNGFVGKNGKSIHSLLRSAVVEYFRRECGIRCPLPCADVQLSRRK